MEVTPVKNINMEGVGIENQVISSTGDKNAPPDRMRQREERWKEDTDPKQLQDVLNDIKRDLKILHNIDIRFKVHEATGKTMVTVIDSETDKVIREIPPSEILNLAAKIDQMMGILFDKKG